jgi:hypothetical protein
MLETGVPGSLSIAAFTLVVLESCKLSMLGSAPGRSARGFPQGSLETTDATSPQRFAQRPDDEGSRS